MKLAELAYEHIKTLPDEQAREVLDFIGFLKEKQERSEILDLMNAQETALKPIWDNPVDEVWLKNSWVKTIEPLATDEIIEEIHTIRREHAARFDFDIERIIADLKKSEQEHTDQGWPLAQAQERPHKSNTAFKRIRLARR